MSERSSSAKSARPPARHQAAKYLVLAALSALAAFAAVYVIAGRPDNDRGAAPASQTQAAKPQGGPQEGPQTGAGVNPLSTGAMTTFVFKKQPEALPDIAFVDGAGKPVRLADWRGKVVLLNLWATWCAPCREEMPALDKLQAELGSDKFQVVALAVDKAGIEGAKKFLDEIKVAHLSVFADPTARVGTELRVIGMPTTILIGADGREIGRLVGPAAWDSAEARRLVEGQL